MSIGAPPAGAASLLFTSMMVLLVGSNNSEALALPREHVDLALRELAVAHDLAEVILDLAQDVDRLPEPLARVGVAELAHAPFVNITLLEPGEGFLQEV